MMLDLVKKNVVFQKVAKIKDLYFEKLLDIIVRVDALAANDSSVLQTLVYLVESSQRREGQQQEVARRLDAMEKTMEKLQQSLEGVRLLLEEQRERDLIRVDAGVRESLDGLTQGMPVK